MKKLAFSTIAFLLGAQSSLACLDEPTYLAPKCGGTSSSRAEEMELLFLSTMGAIFLIFLVYGWLVIRTAHGDKKKVEKGKKTIKNTLVTIAIFFFVSLAIQAALYFGSEFATKKKYNKSLEYSYADSMDDDLLYESMDYGVPMLDE